MATEFNRLSISAAPFFEDADHSLEMFIFARWPRINFTCGNCESAVSPLSTPSPTPGFAETTVNPTPGPTCPSDVISGDFGANLLCIINSNYTENYAPEDSCVINWRL